MVVTGAKDDGKGLRWERLTLCALSYSKRISLVWDKVDRAEGISDGEDCC